MVTPSELLNRLPTYKGQEELIVSRQSDDDIIIVMLDAHQAYAKQYDRIYKYFDTGNTRRTARGLFDFCRRYLHYNLESGRAQSVKSPAAILQPGTKIDCKHYSQWCGGILGAIQRNVNSKLDWFYRFASYDASAAVSHVFIVVMDGSEEIWIDPIPEVRYFNEQRTPTFIQDEMALYSISGRNPSQQATKQILVPNPQDAYAAFLVELTNNFFNLKDLLKRHGDTVHSELKLYCEANGFDFTKIAAILQG